MPRNPGGPPLIWITNKTIARQLKNANCSIVAVLADIARDKKVDAALRFRAADRIASLLFMPHEGEREVTDGTADVAGIISNNWRRDGMGQFMSPDEAGRSEEAREGDGIVAPSDTAE
jgi:hypothetical protein